LGPRFPRRIIPAAHLGRQPRGLADYTFFIQLIPLMLREPTACPGAFPPGKALGIYM